MRCKLLQARHFFRKYGTQRTQTYLGREMQVPKGKTEIADDAFVFCLSLDEFRKTAALSLRLCEKLSGALIALCIGQLRSALPGKAPQLFHDDGPALCPRAYSQVE